MIATVGYDGFLYSIGYLAGRAVALFVVAEPIKRLGKYTFSDALDAKSKSRGVRLMAAISTPTSTTPDRLGVVLVGVIVIIIVPTAGMASTTYVQFIKGGMLIVFSTLLVALVLSRGLSTSPDSGGIPYHEFVTIEAVEAADGSLHIQDPKYTLASDWPDGPYADAGFVKLAHDGRETFWLVDPAEDGRYTLRETLSTTLREDGTRLFNGAPAEEGYFFTVGHMDKIVQDGQEVQKTRPLDPFQFLSTIRESRVILWGKKTVLDDGEHVTIYYPKPTEGSRVLRPGLQFKLDGAAPLERLDFISLMLALFCGTAALPHILIRYYTVSSPAAARKSTIVAIAAIGFFYILTMFLGLGAMTGGVVNLLDNNMSAPLLAQSFGTLLFAIISAVAFATVLGTVSGLIVAATGAIAHDLLTSFLRFDLSDQGQVVAGKISAVVVGVFAIFLGSVFQGMNVSFLVGWAFAVAASANLPAIVMLLFWKKTTSQGVALSILMGIVSAVGLILLSPDMFERYGMLRSQAPIPLSSPAIFSIPISFVTLVVVSLLTQPRKAEAVAPVPSRRAAAED